MKEIITNNYNKWLVASDIDGTMNSKLRTLPKRNRDAVKQFIHNGGNFTLASGRPVASARREYMKVKPNCPAVVLNGSGIYDYEKEKMVYKKTLSFDAREYVKSIQNKYSSLFNRVEVGIFFEDKVYVTRYGILSWGQLTFDRAVKVITDISEVPEDGWMMVVFWGTPGAVSKIEKDMMMQDKAVFNYMKSSSVSINMLPSGVHKGTAIMALAQMLGVERENVGAIGDYYNDLDMLKTVGVPACAGQAPKMLREMCTFVSCHCNKGCVAEFLSFIEDSLMKTQAAM